MCYLYTLWSNLFDDRQVKVQNVEKKRHSANQSFSFSFVLLLLLLVHPLGKSHLIPASESQINFFISLEVFVKIRKANHKKLHHCIQPCPKSWMSLHLQVSLFTFMEYRKKYKQAKKQGTHRGVRNIIPEKGKFLPLFVITTTVRSWFSLFKHSTSLSKLWNLSSFVFMILKERF